MLFISLFRQIKAAKLKSFCSKASSVNYSVVHQYFKELMKEYEQAGHFPSLCTAKKEHNKELYSLLKRFYDAQDNLAGLQDFKAEKCEDESFSKLLEEEVNKNINDIDVLKDQIILNILDRNGELCHADIMLEVSAGVGGQEAMLFAHDLFNMYVNYVRFQNWSCDISDFEDSESGGIRHGCIFISGKNSFRLLSNEGGVHRVQRIPATERAGRTHTSTATVAILPQPSAVDIVLKDKDLKIETKTARGPGGQRVNKIETAVRIHHIPSNLVVECQVHRSQEQNKSLALQKLRTKLYEQQIEKMEQTTKSSRKAQVRNRLRNEKVRTYNFNQDRITDHRFGITVHNLSRFLAGEKQFHEFVVSLMELCERNRISEFLQSLEKERKAA